MEFYKKGGGMRMTDEYANTHLVTSAIRIREHRKGRRPRWMTSARCSIGMIQPVLPRRLNRETEGADKTIKR
ncbi:MAG: hypothetical protein GY859_00715 [Desulfobacterales bacterium]|nr:hypothetical protein [Desulfobacterales bacterium]